MAFQSFLYVHIGDACMEQILPGLIYWKAAGLQGSPGPETGLDL